MTDRQASHQAVKLPLKWRVVISLLLIVHVVAIIMPPFMLQASGPVGSSPIGETVMNLLSPYIDIAFLNHGYAFFAPDPGPSHLFRARIEFADGRPPIEQTFPDLRRQRPRLLYHRHFMLSEQLHELFLPPQPPAEMTADVAAEPSQLEDWRIRRRVYELKWQSYVNHLRAKHGASRVTLTRVRHRMIDVPEVQQQGRRLDDRETYFDLSEDGLVGEPL